jgi:hypothetical protein
MATHHHSLGAPGTVEQIPAIPGWITSARPTQDGRELVAIRTADLTDYQRTYGCLPEVKAADPRELECLCIAQLLLAAMVDRAAAGVL